MSKYTFWVLNDRKKFKILNLQNTNSKTLLHKLEKNRIFYNSNLKIYNIEYYM